MQLASLYQPGQVPISFELFPPKTVKGEQALMRHVEALAVFEPAYVTCTYGAGGSTQEKTLQIVSSIKSQFQIPVASHLTCVGATVEQLRAYLERAKSEGVDFIVALRGDPPQGQEAFAAVEGGLRYANELVTLIRGEFPEFGIAVAGYPEVHQEAVSAQADLENLKRKVDAGGEVVITQLFYDNEAFLRFRDRYEAAGIKAPLVPGILPVTNLDQIQRISGMCGATLPETFVRRLGEKQGDLLWQEQVGIEQATEQVRQLMESGVTGLHFYVLNKSGATARVLSNLDLGRVNP